MTDLQTTSTAGGWITSGDHKSIGRLYLLIGLLAVVIGGAAAAGAALGDADGHPLTEPASRFGALAVALLFVVGIPSIWLGLATSVVPLQLGAVRVAFQRLQLFSAWLFALGGAVVLGAHAGGRAELPSLGSSFVPTVATPEHDLSELLVAGQALVALATFVGAAGILVTILTRRAPGMRLVHMPLFSWSALATAAVLVLVTPMFLAGLVIAWFEVRYGSGVFTAPGGGRVWQHLVWAYGRPEALLFATAGAGIFADIVATAVRRPLLLHPVVRALVVAAPLLSLAIYANRTNALVGAFAPIANPGTLVAIAPIALLLLLFIGSARKGGSLVPGVIGLLGFVLCAGTAKALSLGGLFADMDPTQATAFRGGQASLLVIGTPLLALAAGLAHWSPKIAGRPASVGLAGLQVLSILGGSLLMAVPAYVQGFGAEPLAGVITALGAFGVAAGGVLLLGCVVAAGTEPAPPDPEEGLTLEWAAPSPPPPANFEELPEVTSPYPLHDTRVAVAAGEER